MKKDERNKMSIYLTEKLRKKIDEAYDSYRQEVGRGTGVPVRAVSKSAWILSLLTPALDAVGR
jgi:hypothetical protein